MHGDAVTRGSGRLQGPRLLQRADELCRLLYFVQCCSYSLPGAQSARSPSRAAQSPLQPARGLGLLPKGLKGAGGVRGSQLPASART